MSDWRVAAVGAALMIGLGWLTGAWAFFLVFGVTVALVMWLNARDWNVYGADPWDLPSTAPKLPSADDDAPSIDLDDEIEDLLRSAIQLAVRRIEDVGRLEPFVMFEDADGDVRVRKVQVDDPELMLARARTIARQVDPSAPRVVLAVPGRVELKGRTRAAILLEASEYRFRDRTMAFAQLYRPKRFLFAAVAEGRPMYIGESLHLLRFAPASASPV
jgi:hypothetical protein